MSFPPVRMAAGCAPHRRRGCRLTRFLVVGRRVGIFGASRLPWWRRAGTERATSPATGPATFIAPTVVFSAIFAAAHGDLLVNRGSGSSPRKGDGDVRFVGCDQRLPSAELGADPARRRRDGGDGGARVRHRLVRVLPCGRAANNRVACEVSAGKAPESGRRARTQAGAVLPREALAVAGLPARRDDRPTARSAE
jgi:hypothetical protein